MTQSPSPPSNRLVLPMFLAALLGGGVAAGVTAFAVGGDGGKGTTTTVVRQASLASGGGNHENVRDGLTASDIYKRYAPGVVFIRALVVQQSANSPFDFFVGPQRSESTGSGFVVDGRGDILTNNHVIDGARSVTVQFADKKTVKAKVVGTDPSTDLALLNVDPEGLALTTLPLGSSKDVQVGDPTIAIGNPFGLDRTLTTGVVSALQREIHAPNGWAIRDVIQTDAAINPGNSGGPLIDAAGHVIGINSQIETGGAGNQGNVGIGFAVPIDTAKSILPSLKAGQAVERAYLGVETITVDGSLSALDLPTSHGALVQRVEAGSPADAAGLQAGQIQAELQGSTDTVLLGGDIITRVDGKEIKTKEQLSQLVASHKPGDKVRIEIARKSSVKTLRVTLGTRPATVQTG
jgi:S1-C subfamily serine protease